MTCAARHGGGGAAADGSSVDNRDQGAPMAAIEPSPCIVVGYDGSPSARAALRLAVDRVRDGKLFLVHGYGAPADFWGSEHYDTALQIALARAEELVERAASEVEPRLADVAHEIELIPGRPADVIAAVAESRNADEIIVGTRGYGPLRGVALGSVAHALLHQAACPVTVIPDAAVERLDAAMAERSAIEVRP
jgi:nucleotide-binding universal stress UspA family protein